MKILISYRGSQRIRFWETGDLIAQAFEQLGHEVDRYGFIYETEEWFTTVITQNGCSDDVFSKKYDLHIYMECNDPASQYPELKYINAKHRIYWEFDTSYHPEWSLNLIKYFDFDHLFLANPLYVDLLNIRHDGKEFATYLPYACSNEHVRFLDYPKTLDVALVGSKRPDRVELIKLLCDAGIDAKLISNVFKENYIDALASAKIIVNQNPLEGRGLLNMRSFEAPAAGSYLLTEVEDYNINVRKDESISEVISPYIDVNELANICKDLINNRELLDYYREWQQQTVLEKHMYINRAKTILEIMELNHE